jgi:glycerol-3-phosphate acyltransferase PlsY
MHDVSLQILASCVISYLIGSLPFGVWVGLLTKGVDIRTLGSKNIGATNVLRVLGPGPGFAVMLLDTVKGGVGIWLAAAFIPNLPMSVRVLLGFCAVVGHTFSPFLRFKGGKGVSTTLGVLLALSWPVGVVALVVWTSFVALTRYVSIASIAAGISLPIASWWFLRADDRLWMVGLTIAILILVVIKHRENIKRLAAGTEPKFGQRVAAPMEGETPIEPKFGQRVAAPMEGETPIEPNAPCPCCHHDAEPQEANHE